MIRGVTSPIKNWSVKKDSESSTKIMMMHDMIYKTCPAARSPNHV